MGGFILGAFVALLIGMRLARLIDGNKGARAGYKKAKGADIKGARKKANGAFFALFRFALLLILIGAAVLYGWMSTNSA
ncbi:hypothetical protein ACTI_58110 [Actinoplanes sp. OR16]|uniref:hypothetical protein n=1 Tax=Actinoplanes sp. OR16 TaxID=946334 RepID=UPI000F704267|nr:hypothetical protein [Actinoplanes sp. OR16]BBH69126.1 hypothetical protein ACTI_58110 [Actinoplanes sp. OR16]